MGFFVPTQRLWDEVVTVKFKSNSTFHNLFTTLDKKSTHVGDDHDSEAGRPTEGVRGSSPGRPWGQPRSGFLTENH